MQQPQTKGAQCPKLGNIGAATGWNQNPGRDSGKSGGKQRSKGGGSRGNVGRALWAPTQGIMYIYLQLWLIPWDDDNWFWGRLGLLSIKLVLHVLLALQDILIPNYTNFIIWNLLILCIFTYAVPLPPILFLCTDSHLSSSRSAFAFLILGAFPRLYSQAALSSAARMPRGHLLDISNMLYSHHRLYNCLLHKTELLKGRLGLTHLASILARLMVRCLTPYRCLISV